MKATSRMRVGKVKVCFPSLRALLVQARNGLCSGGCIGCIAVRQNISWMIQLSGLRPPLAFLTVMGIWATGNLVHWMSTFHLPLERPSEASERALSRLRVTSAYPAPLSDSHPLPVCTGQWLSSDAIRENAEITRMLHIFSGVSLSSSLIRREKNMDTPMHGIN
ncbi:hypothetical protein CPB84DRAFT_378456 [Gymnopilus junonius]|uniref:Uncharacterized protein n=1 Tax=Gymnopilus junonius TaxID=109634 RepID=A0A9P5NDI0_GYMJU|nr:hypothetical protein CPB84DRAFT_378456 [Gymnopilus junonius]